MTNNSAESVADGSRADQADRGSTDYVPADYAPVIRPMESTGIVRSDASALADLQLHWGSAYEIGLDGDVWSATFRGTADELRAHTSLELRVLIRADYSYRQQAGPARRTGSGGGQGVIRGERMSL
ncbi:MAG TPA: hypothetical protein VEJ42_07865 [Streptosporangiaceae bacterium]|nr:hypothetical protein [Streptosporangiaceae bacterium]